jgi:hypothetical protein
MLCGAREAGAVPSRAWASRHGFPAPPHPTCPALPRPPPPRSPIPKRPGCLLLHAGPEAGLDACGAAGVWNGGARVGGCVGGGMLTVFGWQAA